MSERARVVWSEGMFLRTQHFQQQDRWLETLVRGRTAAMRPYPWGVTEIAIDRDLLATGRFAVTATAGVFEDGTPFAIPGETDHPAPLELPDSTRNALVYLVAPVRQAGAVEILFTGHDRDNAGYTANHEEPMLPLRDQPGLSLSFPFGGAHASGFNMVFCDGSAHRLGYDIDAEVWRRMGGRDDGAE